MRHGGMVSVASAEPPMNDVYDAALEVQDFFGKQGWKYCLIGGLAVIRWGYLRTTRDADFSLLTGFGDEAAYIKELSLAFRGREQDEKLLAQVRRVYRAYASNGAEIDIAFAALP